VTLVEIRFVTSLDAKQFIAEDMLAVLGHLEVENGGVVERKA